MIEKIQCKNGNILIFSDDDQIIKSHSNDINVIDISKIKNDIEQLEKQKQLIIKANAFNRETRKKNKRYTILLLLISLSVLINPVFNTLADELFLMEMVKFLTLVTVPLLTLTEIFGILPAYKRDIENNNRVLNFIEKHKEKLEKKIEKLQHTRSYSVIREGQEFTIAENKGIVNALLLLKSYYGHQQLVNAQFTDLENLKEDIKLKFAEPFIACEVDGYNQDIVIDEVYDNFIKAKQDELTEEYKGKRRIKK